MKEVRSLAILGPSMVFFSDCGDAGTMQGLQASALAETSHDVEWSCQSVLLFPGASMAERTLKFVADNELDAVVLVLSAFPFTHLSVGLQVRRRWPRLYPVVKLLTERLRDVAGGETGASPRRWLFSLPRRIGLWTVGGGYELTPEEFAACVTEALTALRRDEQLAVICRLPVFYWPLPKNERLKAEANVAWVNEMIAGYCESVHIPAYDLSVEASDRGVELAPAADGLHFSSASRQFEAETIARYILADGDGAKRLPRGPSVSESAHTKAGAGAGGASV
jgi:hypothetical protein